MSKNNYIDKKTLQKGDLIMYVVDEFGLRELTIVARIKEVDSDGDIFMDELWANIQWDLYKNTGLQPFYHVLTNFGKENWNGIDKLKHELPEYFI